MSRRFYDAYGQGGLAVAGPKEWKAIKAQAAEVQQALQNFMATEQKLTKQAAVLNSAVKALRGGASVVAAGRSSAGQVFLGSVAPRLATARGNQSSALAMTSGKKKKGTVHLAGNSSSELPLKALTAMFRRFMSAQEQLSSLRKEVDRVKIAR